MCCLMTTTRQYFLFRSSVSFKPLVFFAFRMTAHRAKLCESCHYTLQKIKHDCMWVRAFTRGGFRNLVLCIAIPIQHCSDNILLFVLTWSLEHSKPRKDQSVYCYRYFVLCFLLFSLETKNIQFLGKQKFMYLSFALCCDLPLET